MLMIYLSGVIYEFHNDFTVIFEEAAKLLPLTIRTSIGQMLLSTTRARAKVLPTTGAMPGVYG